MKFKKILIIAFAVALFVCSASLIAASDTVRSYLFKGKLVINNQVVDLKQEVYNINGSVYVPIRSFAESMRGHVGYDKNDQTIYVEHSNSTNKKSTVNDKKTDDMFTLHAFSSQSEYIYGDPIEVWTRISNDTENAVNISHGPSLIKYSITDEDGLTSSILDGMALEYSTFQSGDELNKSLGHYDLLVYNLDKIGIDNKDDVQAYLKNAERPSMLPRGEYTITVKAEYTIEGEVEKRTLEVSIPISIK